MNEEELQDDIVIDEDSEDTDNDTVKKLRARLKKTLEEKQDYLDKWQRDKAEFINSRKRDNEEKTEFIKFSEENLISELIPVLDSFDLAVANKEAWEKVDKNWRVGIEYIHSQLLNILNSHGLEKINPLGKLFDPKEHHSVGVINTESEDDDHKVLEVTSPGYSLNGKIIKAAQVKVGQLTQS